MIDYLEDILDIVFSGYSVALIIFFAIIAVVALLLSIAYYLVEAYATYKLSKKLGRSMCILAWAPIFGRYFRTFVICDMTDTTFKALDRFKIPNRRNSFWLYLAILILGNSLITGFITVVNVLPGMGQIISAVSTFLYLIPVLVTRYMEFVYLRDAMDLFRVDRKSNQTWAFIATVAELLATQGVGRIVCLYSLLKKEPLPTTHIEIDID